MTVISEADEAGEEAVSRLAARFPADFAWGAATSAYQIEGAVDVDGRGRSIWDTFSALPGRTHAGETGAVACDHYHRWREDLDLMAELGLRAYRFSLAWPRIQPLGDGPANPVGLDFYDRLVDGLLERGIEPWITLYHWDLPQALEERGGWLAPEIVDRFATYAQLAAGRLGDRVRHWITLNEPRTFTQLGYGTGLHAPGRQGWSHALRAAHHAHLAHAAAVPVIRAASPKALVGISHDVADVQAGSGTDADLAAAARHDAAMHRWFLDPSLGGGYPAAMQAWYERHGLLADLDLEAVRTAPSIDFLAVNYYRRERVIDAPARPTNGPGTALLPAREPSTANGWEIAPDGLRSTLARLAADYAPPAIVVTENGAAFADAPDAKGLVHDATRRRYLAQHIAAAASAIEGGVPLIGYFAWSLLDNFEWALGYAARFGIVHVDFETQRRRPKASARWYTSLIRGR